MDHSCLCIWKLKVRGIVKAAELWTCGLNAQGTPTCWFGDLGSLVPPRFRHPHILFCQAATYWRKSYSFVIIWQYNIDVLDGIQGIRVRNVELTYLRYSVQPLKKRQLAILLYYKYILMNNSSLW